MNGHSGANGEGQEEERELVTRARDGDLDAMRRLVERHQRDVLRLALSVLGDRHDAEDAMQEVFVNALSSLGRFRGDSRLATWLYSITVNVCREQQRRRRWNLVSLDGLSGERPELADGAPGSDPHGQATRGRIRRELAQALQVLSPAERQVFALRKYQELSVHETANVLGLAEGTVKALLFRGLRKLRRTLADRSGPGSDS